MGFLKGSLGIKRYFIEKPDVFSESRDKVVERLLDFQFRSIEGSAVEEAAGWVSPFRSFDPKITVEDTFLDSNIFLAMRIDRKTVPRLLLSNKVNQLLDSGSVLPKGKAELKQLKEDMYRELLIKALPEPRIIEGVIDLPHATLYLNTASHRVSGLFLSLFEKTFDILPIHIDPTGFAFLTLKDEAKLQVLADSEESCFHDI
ncbi:MAG: recombination-associated protein RdgC [Acidobacteria bacterium]|nr:recombination-associated protein RdgC [Acidobacteriota bacterium]